MKKKIAQKKVIVSIVVFLVVVGALFAVIFYLYNMKVKSKESHDRLKNDIESKKRKIQGLSEDKLKFAEAIAVWEGFDDESKELNGIKITLGMDFIDKLKDKYKLSNFSRELSKPEEVNTEKEPELANEIIKVSESKWQADFSAVTDVDVYNFIAELQESFPGYVSIYSLSVTREEEVTKEHLELLAKGEYPPLVNVKLRFYVRDFKYDAPLDEESENEEEQG